MTEEKASEPTKEFNDKGKSEAKLNKSSHVVKLKIIGVLTEVLILGVVLSLILFFYREEDNLKSFGRSHSGRGRNSDISSRTGHRDTSGRKTEGYVCCHNLTLCFTIVSFLKTFSPAFFSSVLVLLLLLVLLVLLLVLLLLHFPKFDPGAFCCLRLNETSPNFKDCFHFTEALDLRFLEFFYSL